MKFLILFTSISIFSASVLAVDCSEAYGKTDGSPFLRTVDDDGINNYVLVYQNKISHTSIWSLTVAENAHSPEMRFTTIDGRDFSAEGVVKRNVTVTMSIGPLESPVWEGIVVTGSHTLEK